MMTVKEFASLYDGLYAQIEIENCLKREIVFKGSIGEIPSLIGGMELLCFWLTKPTAENGNTRMNLVVAIREED